MSTEENKRARRCYCEAVLKKAHLDIGDECCAEGEQEALAKKIFGLALALATEPSKLGQLRQMLAQLREQSGLPEDFSTWAIEHIDERVMSMALQYAHDAEIMLQMLSFK